VRSNSTQLFPKLSIIVPSYNQGDYIEETLLSIINQDYPNKELIIIDGGSTDNSVSIIKKYEQHIAYWVSEKDKGQSHAINKGFARATGDYIAWMNSDDLYYKDAFKTIFSTPGIEQYDFIFGPICSGREPLEKLQPQGRQKEKFSLFNLLHFFYSVEYIIPSQSVFIQHDFLKKHNIQFLDEAYHFCMDLEWYCRISLAKPRYYRYAKPLSFFRINESTKTGSPNNGIQQEAVQVFLQYRKYLTPAEVKSLFDTLFLHRVLPKLYNGSIKKNVASLLAIMYRIPRALKDRRFLGLLKMSLKG